MKAADIIKEIADKLHSNASVKTIYGDQIETQGKTIIPVSKVAYGFGGGFGEGKKGEKEKAKPMDGEGGGGGGGISMRPVGVIEITAEATRFVPIHPYKQMIKGILIGGLLALVLRRILR